MTEEINLYEYFKSIIGKLRENSEITELEFNVMTSELIHAESRKIPFNIHQEEYLQKKRWLISEVGTEEEKTSLQEYLQIYPKRNFETPQHVPFVKSKLCRIMFQDFIYRKAELRSRIYS